MSEQSENTNATAPIDTAAPIPEKKKRSKIFFVILAFLIAGATWFGISKYLYSRSHEATDDAQVAANISPVISKIPGYVTEVKVEDYQVVKKGDTLMILDDKDMRIMVAQAEAALQTAKSNRAAAAANTRAAGNNIGSTNAAVATANAQIQAAEISARRAGEDYQRYANLIKDHSVTQQQYEQALAAKQMAEAQVQVLRNQRNQAAAQAPIVNGQTNATSQSVNVADAMIKQREVDVENAKLNLSYTVITAKESGRVSKVGVQVGQYLQPGQSVFSVVLSDDKWVIANFKETQYNKMMEGQKVSLHVDALPNHDFEGVINSFSPATGSQFAILPPDNASGNFVKVVQRLPVKITFTNPNDSLMKRLRPGMNVDVDVHVGR